MADARVLLMCGVGGAGKTTAAAAIAVAYARAGHRVVVMTIDPARRLADALGVGDLGNVPVPVALDASGELSAMMLDRAATWDEAVHRYSPDEDTASKLLANRYYRRISTRLTGSHEYMASEKLYDLVHDGRWDVVVVDTPPAQHAVEFFKAPDRVARLFDRRVLDVLTDRGSGFFGGTGGRVGRLARRIAGDGVASDIAEFFSLIAHLGAGFRARSAAVSALVQSSHTDTYLVTSPHGVERTDAAEFLAVLSERRIRFSGYVVNRVVDPPRIDVAAWSTLPPPPPGVEAASWQAAMDELRALPARITDIAERQRQLVADLAATNAVWTLPDVAGGVRTVEGLAELSSRLPPLSPPR